MENTELMTVEHNQLSTSVFSDPESFQKIFDIGKMFASSSLVPQAYQGKPMDCTIAVDMANRMGPHAGIFCMPCCISFVQTQPLVLYTSCLYA